MDSTARSILKRYLPDALLLAVLFALTLKFTYDIAAVRDLGTDDETNYLANGHFLPKWGLPAACNSPLYIIWYNVWDRLHLDPIFVYYANWQLLLFLLAASMYVLTRVLGGFRVGALLIAFLTLTSGIAEVWPYPMHLATFVLIGGAALAARLRSWPWSLLVIGVSFAVVSFVRPEFTVALVLFGPVALVCAIGVALRRPELRLRLLAAVFLMVVLIAGLFIEFGNPLAGGRSFMAFGQHYALKVCVQRRIDADPWTNWETITRADFGDADSIPQALRNNFLAFAGHVWANLSLLPHYLNEITTPQLELGSHSQIVFRIVLLGFAAAGVVGLVRRWFHPPVTDDPANHSLRVVLGMFLFSAAPTAIALVVVYPRLHYLIPLATVGGALAFSGYLGFPRLMARLRWLETWPALAATVVLLGAVTPNQVHCWSVQQCLRTDWGTQTKPSLDVQRTVAIIRGLRVHSFRPLGVLESDYSRAFYAGWDFEKVDHWTKTEGFWQFMAANHVSVVVLNDRLLNDTRFRDDPEFQEFAAQRKIRHFHFFTVPNTTIRVAVRAEVLPALAPRWSVVRDMLHDNEYTANLIHQYYQRYLARTPNPPEVAYWATLFEWDTSVIAIQTEFLSSAEFYGRVGNTDKTWVNAVYRELLGRTAETAEESHCLEQLAAGISRIEVAHAIASSSSRESYLVQSYYQRYLGRLGSAAEIAYWVNDMQEGATDEEVLAGILSAPEFYEDAGNTGSAWVDTLYRNLFYRAATTEEESKTLQKLAAQ